MTDWSAVVLDGVAGVAGYPTPHQWLPSVLSPGARVGSDPRLVSISMYHHIPPTVAHSCVHSHLNLRKLYLG